MKIKLYAYASRITVYSPIRISVQEFEHVELAPLSMMPIGEFEIDLPLVVPTEAEFNTFQTDSMKRARLDRIENLRKQLEALDSLSTDAYDQVTSFDEPGSIL